MAKTWMGVDESGKGDYFGYLVVSAVIVDEEKARRLEAAGVKDSKKISDISIPVLASLIKKTCSHDIVKISPERYNTLYKKFKNMNKMLAWAHSQAIENMLAKHDCDHIVVDKFAEPKVLRSALKERGKKAKIIQVVRAESDTAVAAASILARAEFLRTLRKLSLEIGYKLPKGATHVEEAAKHLIEKNGDEVLPYVAKLHFKITKRIRG